VSFAAPWVLLALLVLPLLAVAYLIQQRRQTRGAGAFVSAPLVASVAPRRPRWRRHVPALLMALALVALIAAVAKPQHRVTVPVKGATVMLVNDVSDSMTSTDVKPSRLAAAQKAAISFTEKVTGKVAIGSVEFARRPTLLQSPSTDHALARQAVADLAPGGGGTAIGEALQTALQATKTAPKVGGKEPPAAIVLLSDGYSNVGVSPLTVAQAAKKAKVKIYTIAIGTSAGTMQLKKTNGSTETVPASVAPAQLRDIAQTSGGQFFSAPDQARAGTIYSQLARALGHQKLQRSDIALFTAIGLALAVFAAALSLWWFGALA
jgi:Ca-activated chloride channel family protein